MERKRETRKHKGKKQWNQKLVFEKIKSDNFSAMLTKKQKNELKSEKKWAHDDQFYRNEKDKRVLHTTIFKEIKYPRWDGQILRNTPPNKTESGRRRKCEHSSNKWGNSVINKTLPKEKPWTDGFTGECYQKFNE